MEITQTEKNNASLLHLSSFGGIIIPFGSLILPIVLWQAMKKDSDFIDKHGKQAVNFNLSFMFYNIIAVAIFLGSALGVLINALIEADGANNIHDVYGTLISVGGVVTGLVVLSLIGLVKILFIAIAAIRASQGDEYKYPLTIPFIK